MQWTLRYHVNYKYQVSRYLQDLGINSQNQSSNPNKKVQHELLLKNCILTELHVLFPLAILKSPYN